MVSPLRRKVGKSFGSPFTTVIQLVLPTELEIFQTSIMKLYVVS